MGNKAQVLFNGLGNQKYNCMNRLSVNRFQIKRVLREEEFNQRIPSDHERYTGMRQADSISNSRTHQGFTILQQSDDNSLINICIKRNQFQHLLQIVAFIKRTFIIKRIPLKNRIQRLDLYSAIFLWFDMLRGIFRINAHSTICCLLKKN